MPELRQARWSKGIAGGALLASLALARGLVSADAAGVYFAGARLPVVCVSRLLLGVSCPGCGMTRSILLTLGGDLRGAFDVNPGGPLLVLALVLLGVQLLASALRSRGPGADRRRTPRRLLTWASAYGAVVAAAMIIHWVSDLFAA